MRPRLARGTTSRDFAVFGGAASGPIHPRAGRDSDDSRAPRLVGLLRYVVLHGCGGKRDLRCERAKFGYAYACNEGWSLDDALVEPRG